MIPVVFFGYTIGYSLLYDLILSLALRLEAAIEFKDSEMSDLFDIISFVKKASNPGSEPFVVMVCQPFLIGVVPRFQITVFVKEFKRETRSYPKFDPEIAKFPKSEFSYLGQFMPHMTDFVKNLQRKATLSKISSSVKKLRSQSILQSWFVNPF